VSISRRTFPEAAGLSSLAAERLVGAGAKLPARILGKTGVQVSIPAFGGGSRFLLYDDDTAVEAVNKALHSGVTCIDTAQQYASGLSERRMGKTLERRRDQVFLATKIVDRDGAQTERRVEASLEALRTGRPDQIQIHTLLDAVDLTVIETKGGVLEKVLKRFSEFVDWFFTEPKFASTLLRWPANSVAQQNVLG
jgi:aryl-alcohol dehydrogenase-like predicted oxidoreductase